MALLLRLQVQGCLLLDLIRSCTIFREIVSLIDAKAYQNLGLDCLSYTALLIIYQKKPSFF